MTWRPSEVAQCFGREIRECVARHDCRNPRVFCESELGINGVGDELELLIEAAPGTTLFTIGAMTIELEELAPGIRVLVLTEGCLPNRDREAILAAARPV